jgi:hypothetical protein
MVHSGGVWWSDPGIVRRGLSPDDRNVLREAIDFCEQVRKTGEKGLRLGARLGGDIDAWNGIIARSQDLEQRAHGILEME